jgi:DNA-binding CsgD family transcriptional regulator
MLYGEWLRRQRRGIDARHRLRTTHHMFTVMGADGSPSARPGNCRQSRRDGPQAQAATNGDLIPQEAHTVRLVREQLSNHDIGARLFISPGTVGWHLGKIFAKLGVTSRRHLQR